MRLLQIQYLELIGLDQILADAVDELHVFWAPVCELEELLVCLRSLCLWKLLHLRRLLCRVYCDNALRLLYGFPQYSRTEFLGYFLRFLSSRCLGRLLHTTV